jgi:hypothetical protein
MSDLETLEEIASDIDSEGWSDYADDIRGAAEEIQQLRDLLNQMSDEYEHGIYDEATLKKVKELQEQEQ